MRAATVSTQCASDSKPPQARAGLQMLADEETDDANAHDRAALRHVPISLTSRRPASSNGFMGGLAPRALTPLQQRHGRDKRRERNPEEPKVPRVPDRVWSLFPVANAGCQFVWRFGKSGSLQRPPCLSPRR